MVLRDVRREYLHAMRSLWGDGHWITWQPSLRLRLGDIGAVTHGELVLFDSLAGRNIAFASAASGGRDELVYDSNGHASVSFANSAHSDAPVGSLTPIEASVAVSFGKDATAFIALAGIREIRIDSIPSLAAKIMEEYWNGWWQPEYVVITHLVEARSSTILLAAEQGSSVELHASTAVEPVGLRLADLASGFQVTRSRGLGYQLVCQDALTPLFRALSIKKSFWRELRTRYQRQPLESAIPPPPELIAFAATHPEMIFDEIHQPDHIVIEER